MSRRTSRIGLAGGIIALSLVAVGAAWAATSSPTAGSAGMDRADATTFRVFGQPDVADEVYVPVDGDLEREELLPGDAVMFRDVLYALDESDPAQPKGMGDPIGEVLIECLVHTVESEFDAKLVCDAAFELPGKGTLFLVTHFSFSEFEDPGYVLGAVVGGDGVYAGAGGDFTVRDLPRADDPEGPSDSVYEIRL